MGDNIMFECRVEGDPLPTVEWRFINNTTNNSPLISKNTDHVQITDEPGERGVKLRSSLTIMGIVPSDIGHYHCVAKNNAGLDFRVFDLQLSGNINEVHNAPSVALVKVISSSLLFSFLSYPKNS